MTPAEKQKAILKRRQAMTAAGKKMPKKQRPPRQLHPVALERSYYAAILHLTRSFFNESKKAVSLIPEILEARERDLRADSRHFALDTESYGEMIAKTFDDIEVKVAREMDVAEVRRTAKTFGDRVSEFNRTQVDRQFKTVLGVPVLRQERWLKPKLDAYVESNVALIRDITDKGIKDLRTLVMTRTEAGDANRTIARQIRERLDVTRRRARFIARDQVSKLNGKLTELRHKEAGVSEYIWRSVTDGATRISHLKNNGKRFTWSDPPDETGHPGEDFQCRCTPEPVLDEFITEL